ncbi:uncharacterized protein LOC124340657 [Daphnia pulicaria]|uniref:uncharacterized protein LOC124340657 n=1 Tax=Daphnia pulicaria TaxID=35523 RepID=UPI001EEA290D|nr:uncharacterized protein LOC124340657 [Daphnia pulicaria]
MIGRLYSVVLAFSLVAIGCCDSVANAISTNEEALTSSAAPIVELADGAVQAAQTESSLPPPQSMNLESSSSDQQQHKTQDDQILALKGPKFVPEASKNITALAGRVASLNCRIKNLDNWTVSWVRHRDVSLLTVASYTYSSDQRFRAVHKPYFGEQPPSASHSGPGSGGSNGGSSKPFQQVQHLNSDLESLTDTYSDWGLEIHSSQPRDSGIYECQISTTPHRSLFVHLRVVEPSTTVLGGSEVFVGMGSTINLTCVIRLSPEPPNSIRWQHNNQMIGYDSNRGGVSVVTEKGIESSSSLLIQNARPADSGKYVCRPDNAEPATVNVHVLNGESPAAMQHGCSARQLSSAALFFFSVAMAVAANVKAQRNIWSFIYGVT